MCNISLGIEARGEARGIEKTKTEMIINMLKEKVSIDVIAKVAKLPKKYFLVYQLLYLMPKPLCTHIPNRHCKAHKTE